MRTYNVPPGAVTTASNAGAQWGAAAFSLGAWTGEMIGAILMSAGAFVLQRMPSRASARVPLDLVWVVIAIGSLIVAAQYALVLG